MGTTYTGPAEIECPQRCTVPAGATVTAVPRPRHNWGDVATCPNDGCELALLLVTVPAPAAKGA